MYPSHDCLVVIRSSMSPYWTRWWVGAWLMNFKNQNMSIISKNNTNDGTLKMVHTEVSDLTSSDEESMSTNYKRTKTLSSKTWPRFLVIGSSNDKALKKLSPFAIQKGLEGLAGEPKSVKKLRSGSLLIVCATESHSKNLLKSKLLCNISINVTPHTTLNSSKGVVRSRDLEGVSEEEICENLSSQGVSSVKRINVRRNNELVPTNTLYLDLQYTYPSRFCESGLLAHSCCAVHSKPVTVLQMSKVWERTKYMSWKIDMCSMWSI